MSKKNKLDGVYTQFYETHLAGGQPRYRQSLSKTRKHRIYHMYWRVLTELSLNRFKWFGLPDSVDERYLELSLMRQGGVLFFKHQDQDPIINNGDIIPRFDPVFLVQQFTGHGVPNHYDNPTTFRVQSTGGIRGTYTAKQAVPIWGNYMRTPDMDIINVYADRLTELDTTIDVNTVNMRYPRVLVMSEEARLTMENINQQMIDGIPVIKVTPGYEDSLVGATLDMGSHHETIPGLLAAKGKMWNDALMMLGVPTVNQDKKERMITGEAETGKDQAEVIRNIALNSRKQGAEQINTLFADDPDFPDTGIGVEWRAQDELMSMVNQMSNMLGIPDDEYEPGATGGDTPMVGVAQPLPTNDDDEDEE